MSLNKFRAIEKPNRNRISSMPPLKRTVLPHQRCPFYGQAPRQIPSLFSCCPLFPGNPFAQPTMPMYTVCFICQQNLFAARTPFPLFGISQQLNYPYPSMRMIVNGPLSMHPAGLYHSQNSSQSGVRDVTSTSSSLNTHESDSTGRMKPVVYRLNDETVHTPEGDYYIKKVGKSEDLVWEVYPPRSGSMLMAFGDPVTSVTDMYFNAKKDTWMQLEAAKKENATLAAHLSELYDTNRRLEEDFNALRQKHSIQENQLNYLWDDHIWKKEEMEEELAKLRQQAAYHTKETAKLWERIEELNKKLEIELDKSEEHVPEEADAVLKTVKQAPTEQEEVQKAAEKNRKREAQTRQKNAREAANRKAKAREAHGRHAEEARKQAAEEKAARKAEEKARLEEEARKAKEEEARVAAEKKERKRALKIQKKSEQAAKKVAKQMEDEQKNREADSFWQECEQENENYWAKKFGGASTSAAAAVAPQPIAPVAIVRKINVEQAMPVAEENVEEVGLKVENLEDSDSEMIIFDELRENDEREYDVLSLGSFDFESNWDDEEGHPQRGSPDCHLGQDLQLFNLKN